MMDDGRGSLGSGSLFGGGRQSNLTGLSPYLNVDPSYLSSQTPEFIFNQDTKRGRLENSFTAIGSSLILGAVGGGAYGLFDGVRHTGLAEMSGKLRRTQILNHTLKSGASISNSLGALAVIYSSLYALVSLGYENDDEVKSCLSGGLTGLLYKSTSGVRKTATGAAFGFGLAALWSFGFKKNKTVSYYV
jgi:import inner membrane translocase subunit TIM23